MTTRTDRRATGAADAVSAVVASALPGLALEFERHRTRAGRAWRRYRTIDGEVEPLAAAAAYQAWSGAIDAALRTAEAISREHPSDLEELLIQYEVIWWWVGTDDNLLDGSTRRWLGRFRRSVRRLAVGD